MPVFQTGVRYVSVTEKLGRHLDDHPKPAAVIVRIGGIAAPGG